MRKLHVFESVSVDGYVSGPNGDLGWAHDDTGDAELAAWVSANASSQGDLLFGRVTYQMMESFWPTPQAAAQMPAVARGMNAAKKYVASRTLTPRWNNSHLLPGDAVEAVRALKAEEGPPITVLGSGSLVAALGAAGLVDRYQFVVVPIALGSGRTAFSTKGALRLLEHRVFASGRVVLTYGT